VQKEDEYFLRKHYIYIADLLRNKIFVLFFFEKNEKKNKIVAII
jgi:hypothetical protein